MLLISDSFVLNFDHIIMIYPSTTENGKWLVTVRLNKSVSDLKQCHLGEHNSQHECMDAINSILDNVRSSYDKGLNYVDIRRRSVRQ